MLNKKEREDAIAANAIRKSTLKSIKTKRKSRLLKLKTDYENEVREVNIQYAKNPERLKAKYAAEDFARTERAKKRAERRIAAEKRIIEINENKRQFSFAEDLAASILQGIGFAFGIVALSVFDAIAVTDLEDYKNLSIVIYTFFGSSLILMYLCSVLHHALRNTTAKEVFNRLSHVFTFLIIGWGYTAYTLTQIQGTFGWILFGIVWGICAVGAVLYAVFGGRLERTNIVFYCVAGFSGLIALKTLSGIISPISFKMLITASIFYVFALIFYSQRKVKWLHFIGNCIMLAGSIFMFMSMFYLS